MKGFHKKMRLLSLLCLLLCATLLVCACTGGGEEPETTQKAEETTVMPEKPAPQTPPASETKTYTVKVQTSEGGIEGVRLQMCKGETCLSPVTTNASGIATFKLDKTEDITAYRVKLTKFPTGYTGDMQKEYAFAAGTTALGITLTEYRVELNNMMTGVANVDVTVKKGESEVAKSKSDEQGAIVFLLALDTYSVTIDLPEGHMFIGDERSWELNAERKQQTVYLLDQTNLLDKTVTVKDHEGNLVVGATVKLWTPDSAEAVDSAITDEEGKVTFADLNGITNYGVTVALDGFTTQKQYFTTFATTTMEVVLPEITPPSEVTYTANVVLGDGTLYLATPVTVTLVCQQSLGNGYTYTTVATAQTQDGVATFTFVPEMYATYYVSIARKDLPENYVLIDEVHNHNLFGFAENATETAVAIMPMPDYGSETTPAIWYNYSNVEYPFYEVNNEFILALTAGQTYYIQLAWSEGMQMTFVGDVTVTYGEDTYVEGDTIIFVEDSPMLQGNAQAVIAITAEADATVTLTTSEAPAAEETQPTL